MRLKFCIIKHYSDQSFEIFGFYTEKEGRITRWMLLLFIKNFLSYLSKDI